MVRSCGRVVVSTIASTYLHGRSIVDHIHHVRHSFLLVFEVLLDIRYHFISLIRVSNAFLNVSTQILHRLIKLV